MRIEYLIPLISYLLGSIPFGYLLVRLSEGGDIRTMGSGNIGATNVFRRSRWIGMLTLLLDAGKGYLAVVLAGWISGSIDWQGAAAISAIAGHVFTFWLRFKGGKGVATGCGTFLAMAPLAVGTTLVAFVVMFVLTRYISVASIVATALFPFWAYVYGAPPQVVFWGVIGAIIIIAKHHQNIRRLLSGNENKLVLGTRS